MLDRLNHQRTLMQREYLPDLSHIKVLLWDGLTIRFGM